MSYSKPLKDLCAKELENRDQAWNLLEKNHSIQLADISNLLKAEARLQSKTNNGWIDPQLRLISELNTKEEKEAAIRYFLLTRTMFEIANKKIEKAAKLNKIITKNNYSEKIDLINKIIDFLGK